jgi:hypothetical protein
MPELLVSRIALRPLRFIIRLQKRKAGRAGVSEIAEQVRQDTVRWKAVKEPSKSYFMFHRLVAGIFFLIGLTLLLLLHLLRTDTEGVQNEYSQFI